MGALGLLAGGCGHRRYASELEIEDLRTLSILLQRLGRRIQTFVGQRSTVTGPRCDACRGRGARRLASVPGWLPRSNTLSSLFVSLLVLRCHSSKQTAVNVKLRVALLLI